MSHDRLLWKSIRDDSNLRTSLCLEFSKLYSVYNGGNEGEFSTRFSHLISGFEPRRLRYEHYVVYRMAFDQLANTKETEANIQFATGGIPPDKALSQGMDSELDEWLSMWYRSVAATHQLGITKEQYVWWYTRLYLALFPNSSQSIASSVAQSDWRFDCGDARALTKSKFCDVVLDFVHLFCGETTMDMVDFLSTLYVPVCHDRQATPSTVRSSSPKLLNTEEDQEGSKSEDESSLSFNYNNSNNKHFNNTEASISKLSVTITNDDSASSESLSQPSEHINMEAQKNKQDEEGSFVSERDGLSPTAFSDSGVTGWSKDNHRTRRHRRLSGASKENSMNETSTTAVTLLINDTSSEETEPLQSQNGTTTTVTTTEKKKGRRMNRLTGRTKERQKPPPTKFNAPTLATESRGNRRAKKPKTGTLADVADDLFAAFRKEFLEPAPGKEESRITTAKVRPPAHSLAGKSYELHQKEQRLAHSRLHMDEPALDVLDGNDTEVIKHLLRYSTHTQMRVLQSAKPFLRARTASPTNTSALRPVRKRLQDIVGEHQQTIGTFYGNAHQHNGGTAQPLPQLTRSLQPQNETSSRPAGQITQGVASGPTLFSEAPIAQKNGLKSNAASRYALPPAPVTTSINTKFSGLTQPHRFDGYWH